MTEKFSSKVKLGSVLIFHNNRRVPLSSVERMKRKGIYPYYGAQGVIDYIDDFIFEGEYLLIAEDGANLESRTNPICLLTNSSEQFWVNNHAHILTTNDHADVRYIKYYINKMDLSPYITGSAQPKLSKTSLMNVDVFLPDITKQKLIASMLSALDDKIKINNKINSNLEELAQTLYKHWFDDFEFPNEDGKPYRSSGGEMVESELGLIPKGWEVITLSSIIKRKKVKSSPSKSKILIDMANMPSYSISLNSYDQGDKLNTNLFEMREFDILYGSIRPYLGKFGIAPYDGLTTGTIHCFSSLEHNDYSLLASVVFSKDFNDYCVQLSDGTKMPIIKWDDFASYKIVYSNTHSKMFNELLLATYKQTITNVKQNDKLGKVRDLLFPKLMSGEIEV